MNALVTKLNTDEAGKRAGVNRGTIVLWIKAGLLKATNVGDGLKRPRWQIDVEDLDEAIIRRNEFFHNKKERAKKNYKMINSLKPYNPEVKSTEEKKPSEFNEVAKSVSDTYVKELLEENRSLRKKIDELKEDLKASRNANATIDKKFKKLMNDMLEVLSKNE